MALPTDGRSINNILSFTLDAKLPELTDNFFQTNALFQKLYQRQKRGERVIRYRGGAEIRVPIQYAKVPAGSYDRGTVFGSGQTEFATDMQFQWKRVRSEINVDHLDVRKNMGSEAQIIDYVDALAQNAYNSLCDELGFEIFGTYADANNVAQVLSPIPSTNFDGLYNGVLATGSYGGITRGSTLNTPGAAIRANVTNAASAVLSLGLMQQVYGQATFYPDMPDLIVTTQSLFNELWQRTQPQDRNAPGPMRDVGFTTIKFNQAEVIVDYHCPPGYMYFLNTKYMQLWLMEGVDFIRRGSQYGDLGFPIPTQDAFVDQLIVYGDLVFTGPRYQALLYGLA